MTVVHTVKADPSLRYRPLVCASDPGGSRAHASGRWVSIPGQPLGKSALGCAACLLSLLIFRGDRGVRAYITVFLRFSLAVVVVRRWRLASTRGDAVVVSGAAVGARPMLSQVWVAALLRSTSVGLRVLKAAREIDHETRGPGTAGSPVGIPLRAIFSERGGNRVFL